MATYSPSKITKDGNTYNFTDDTKIPLSGTNALAGSIVPDTDNSYDFGSSSYKLRYVYCNTAYVTNLILTGESFSRNVDNSSLLVCGASTASDGAFIKLHSKNYVDIPYAGSVYIFAGDGSNASYMLLKPDGSVICNNKNIAMQEDVVPRSGGAVMTDYFLGRSADTGSLMISGGTSWSSGGSVEAFGSSHSSYAGRVRLQPALSNSNFKTMNLEPSGTWSWSGTACQITSDQRLKQQITEINDKLLDAWEDVELVQFKYNESVDTKGKSARLHTGYVVQQIDSACKSHGVDISAYGLYCHEEYPQETEEVEVEQANGTKTKKTKIIKEANEHYSLRYTEALIVECKYLRRCIARLTARIEELEKGNNIK